MIDISPPNPLPTRVEQLSMRYWWLLVLINVGGTAFGFWYYRAQFALEPVVMLPFVPDSPTATLFFTLSLVLWAYGRDSEYFNALAFLGCWKLGLWTMYVLLMFAEDAPASASLSMYIFLVVSHLGMAVQAFLIPAYGSFNFRGVAVAVAWYGFNDLVDYFVPFVGTPHHTILPAQDTVNGAIQHVPSVHWTAAAGAVALTASGFLILVLLAAQD